MSGQTAPTTKTPTRTSPATWQTTSGGRRPSPPGRTSAAALASARSPATTRPSPRSGARWSCSPPQGGAGNTPPRCSTSTLGWNGGRRWRWEDRRIQVSAGGFLCVGCCGLRAGPRRGESRWAFLLRSGGLLRRSGAVRILARRPEEDVLGPGRFPPSGLRGGPTQRAGVQTGAAAVPVEQVWFLHVRWGKKEKK